MTALLASDLIGAWFDKFGEAGKAVLAIQHVEGSTAEAGEDELEEPEHVDLVIVSLYRSDADVGEVVKAGTLKWCNVSASQPATTVADAVISNCEFFWWSGPEGVIGWEVTPLWPSATTAT